MQETLDQDTYKHVQFYLRLKITEYPENRWVVVVKEMQQLLNKTS